MRSLNGMFSGLGVVAALAMVCGLSTGSVLAEGFDELTPAAAAAVKTLFPAATVTRVGQEREQGVQYYEVVVLDQGARIEVEVTADGSIGEIESVVRLAEVPTAAREQILRNTQGTKVKQVEKHEVRGVPQDGTFVPVERPIVMYEVAYEDQGQNREFVVAEDGTTPRDEGGEDDDYDEGDGPDDDD